METSHCTYCQMPINYDNFINALPLEHIDKDIKGEVICSFCKDKKNQKEYQFINSGQNQWILDLVINTYNSRSLFNRALASVGHKLLPDSMNLHDLASLVKSIPKKEESSKYDAVVLYSGGKDSSYMLIQLAQKKLKVCAWMLNQGYQSPEAISNAQNLCEKLGIPLFIEKPDKNIMDRLFRVGFNITIKDDPKIVKSAMTYGSACWPCFATIASHVTKFCAEHKVKLCFIGTQEGQNRLDLGGKPVLASKELPKLDYLATKFVSDFHDLAKKEDSEAAHILERRANEAVLIPFYEFVKKPDVATQVEYLNQYGWKMPNNTGACSSNCMMNELGRKVMRKNFGFDLYEIIDSNEKRIGNVDINQKYSGAQLDEKAVRLGAKLIKLSEQESTKYGITYEK